SDTAINAGDSDPRAAGTHLACKLAASRLADDLERDVGVDTSVDAAYFNIGVGALGQADLDATVDAADAQAPFADVFNSDGSVAVDAAQFGCRAGLRDVHSAVDAADGDFAGDLADLDFAVDRRNFQAD